jgi:signal transduction histidine kinase
VNSSPARVDGMTLSTKIWLLPIGVGIALALSLLFNLALGARSAAHLEALRSVDNPYLETLLRVNESIDEVRSDFQAGVTEGDAGKIKEAHRSIQLTRNSLQKLRDVEGYSLDGDALAADFEAYQSSASDVADELLARHTSSSHVRQMQAAQKVLNGRSDAMVRGAREAVEQRFAQVARAERMAQWASTLTSLLVLAGLAVSSRLIIRSVWSELQKSHNQLVDAARIAGMSEIATNVLHNVGNVLNSVNVSADLIAGRLRLSEVKGLARAVDLLDANAAALGPWLTDTAQGRALPAYLRELSRTLDAEHAGIAEELVALGKSVEHVGEIIATQQSYAGPDRVRAPVQIGDLLADALRMNAGSLTRHRVEVTQSVADVPVLSIDRHRVLQILVNLVSNAKHAVAGVKERDPRIALGATIATSSLGSVLRITVADNGEGIAGENLVRIFSHGFTTRRDGHGFGLHSCVLAAQEMGGVLDVHSDGPGLGATFTLDIPITAPRVSR